MYYTYSSTVPRTLESKRVKLRLTLRASFANSFKDSVRASRLFRPLMRTSVARSLVAIPTFFISRARTGPLTDSSSRASKVPLSRFKSLEKSGSGGAGAEEDVLGFEAG
jgi:hypothetical protein